MIYCTVDDLRVQMPEQRLVEVSDDAHPDSATGEIQTAVVDKVIASVCTLIDSYVGQRYPLPLPSVPEIIRRIATNLSICDLYDRVREMDVADGVRDRRKEQMRLLDLISSGKLSLGLPTLADGSSSSSLIVTTSTRRQEFPDRRLARMNADTRPWIV